MKKSWTLLLLVLGTSHTILSTVPNHKPAPFWLTRMANEAQKTVGVPQEKRAAVFEVPSTTPSWIGGYMYTDPNQQSYIFLRNCPDYAKTKFAALHEAAHVLHNDNQTLTDYWHTLEQQANYLCMGLAAATTVALLYCFEAPTTLYYCVCPASGIAIGFGSNYYKRYRYDKKSRDIETRADTTAAIALDCKTCLEERIHQTGIETPCPFLLNKGYLSAEKLREISAQHHSNTPCYYHRSPLPRIFHTIQSTPAEQLPVLKIIQDMKLKKSVN